jgi:exopolysaccharide biosynthesis polyprenyl glycosylphosphotransferase
MPDRPSRSSSPAIRAAAVRVVADLAALWTAFTVAFHVYEGLIAGGWITRPHPDSAPYVAITLVFAAVTLLVFWQQGLYHARSTLLNLWELETAIRGVMLSAALLFALLFFLKLESYSRFVVVAAIALAMVFVVLERRVLASFFRRMRLRDRRGRRTLIYGCEKTGQLLMKKIVQSPHLERTVVGFLDDHVPIGSLVCCRITQTRPALFEAPVLGRLETLPLLVEEHQVDELLVAASAIGSDRLQEVIQAARELELSVGMVPSLGDVRADQLTVEDLSAMPVLRPRVRSTRAMGRAGKRAFDVVGAVALLVATAPLWVVAYLLIRLDPTGPVLFAQQRVGLRGRPFRILKFRTMRGDAPPYMSSPPGDVDPRITRTGRFLRRTGIDELPQLVNVLRGEMSLVGPRPEMPHIVQRYSAVERQRLAVRPGVTGLWQLSADRHAEIHENIEYDLYYVNHQSFLLDMLILLETAFFTLGVLAGSLDRRPLRVETAVPHSLVAPAEERYLLVALDQRRNGHLPQSWQSCMEAAYAVSQRWPVRIVVADGNRAFIDQLLAEPMERWGTAGYRTTYAPYRSRAELRRLTAGARLVITDLPHVSRWAEEDRIDELTVEDGGVRWWSRSIVPDPLVADLSQLLTVYVGPPEAAATG